MLAPASRVTVWSSTTVWSAPALAVGAVLSPTVTVTVSVLAKPPGSVTVTLKVRAVSAATAGAVKVGFAAVALDRVTAGPAVRVQA